MYVNDNYSFRDRFLHVFKQSIIWKNFSYPTAKIITIYYMKELFLSNCKNALFSIIILLVVPETIGPQ